ncbi:MAG: hypothetical protein QOF43_2343 [Gaiellaceae bacterium]|nr:hypothetical protein [Gaiellaceae bacterium]
MSTSDLSVETLLRAHAPLVPERLRARVAALEPAPRRSALPSRRLVLVVVPAAVGLAVAAALVNGIVRSGDTKTIQRTAVAGSTVTTPAFGRAEPKDFSTARGSAGATQLQKLAAPNVTSSRLAHTDASLQLRVTDTDALAHATTRATQIATALGGYAKSVRYATPQRGAGEATIDLRVPAQNVKVAIARLAGLGTVVSQQLSVTDLEDKLQTQSSQIAQLRRRVAALRTALGDATLPEGQKVLLRIRLAESKRALSQRLHARTGTLSAGTNAHISLLIGTEKAVSPVVHPRGRVGRMLHSAIGFLALEAIVVLYALIVISPLALAAGLIWLWRRRSVDRLLTT